MHTLRSIDPQQSSFQEEISQQQQSDQNQTARELYRGIKAGGSSIDMATISFDEHVKQQLAEDNYEIAIEK